MNGFQRNPGNTPRLKKSSTEMSKLDPKINFKAFFVNLNEISDKNDIIIKLPVKKAQEATKLVPKPKNAIALF